MVNSSDSAFELDGKSINAFTPGHRTWPDRHEFTTAPCQLPSPMQAIIFRLPEWAWSHSNSRRHCHLRFSFSSWSRMSHAATCRLQSMALQYVSLQDFNKRSLSDAWFYSPEWMVSVEAGSWHSFSSNHVIVGTCSQWCRQTVCKQVSG